MIGLLALAALSYLIYKAIRAAPPTETHTEWQERMDEKHDL